MLLSQKTYISTMQINDFREICRAKTGVTEEFPFDDKTLVFKVMGKMFALCGINSDVLSVNLKCDPERAEALRLEYEAVAAGYHMSKKTLEHH